MSLLFRKTLYTWTPACGIRRSSTRLSFAPVEAAPRPRLIEAVAATMSDSVDAVDRSDLEAHGPVGAAERRIAEASEAFHYEPAWWELAFDETGALIGFHLPAAFRGCERDGLLEATIYYIGVRPEMRGRGHGTELLARTTEILGRAGVWRIYTDTAAVNEPMKAAFRAVGYKEGETREVPVKGRPG